MLKNRENNYNTGHGKRRKHKNTSPVENRRLKNELRRETNRAKQKFINETYNEITKLQQTGRYHLMYQKAKEVEWKKNKRI